MGFSIAVFGLAFLMPGHYLPWATFQAQWISALALLLLATLLLASEGQQGKRLPVPSLAWLALSLAAVPPLQYAAGRLHFLSDAVLCSLYLLAFALAVITGAAQDRKAANDSTKLLLVALLGAGTISVALALVQWLQLGSFLWVADLPPGGRPGANLAQPNHLATLLCLGVVALLHLYQSRDLGTAVCALLMGWLGLGLVMTQSRTGWLSMALLALWCLWHRRPLALRVTAPAVCLGAVLFVVAVLVWRPLNEALLLNVAPLDERLRPGTRWLHWLPGGMPHGANPGGAMAGSRSRWHNNVRC